jgi:hypothetical protein
MKKSDYGMIMNKDSMLKVLLCFLLLMQCQTVRAERKNDIDLITENITKVCDKPDHAGTYWDIKVKGSGEAGIRLKLLGLGKVTGESTFSKGEWEGVQRTIEDSKDYRDCVEKLTPVFLEKFTPLLPLKIEKKKRVLGGIKWQEFEGGVNLTLTSCSRKSSSIVCEFIANATQSDVKFSLSNNSSIYDQNGNKYFIKFASIANWNKPFDRISADLDGELVRGVDTKVLIHFNADNYVTLVSKAFVSSSVNGKDSSFTFRDITMNVE